MEINPSLFSHWTRPVPRYTSYPTALQFQAMEPFILEQHLRRFDATEKPLSLYVHIPFCRTMCLFCACSVVLNRSSERQASYLQALLQEIAQTASFFSKRRRVTQLHLGGGTPTSLTEGEMEQLLETLRRHFVFEEGAEVAIEVDPRTVFGDRGAKLRALRRMGFNRVSFGVQDLDLNVQEAVKRRQSREMTIETYRLARELQFESINIDLIYGLPLQTVDSFRKTAEELVSLGPDRMALFSYAKVPWLKKHQQAIREEDLPTSEEKFQIYTEARAIFLQAGYTAIGLDHFAKQGDALAQAYKEKKLARNFQGYTVQSAETMLGFGVTAIGFVEGAFFQNVKTIEEYQFRLSLQQLPLFRGVVLQKEDVIRRFVIQELMCRFAIDTQQFKHRFEEEFDLHFAKEQLEIERLIQEGLLQRHSHQLQATQTGELFIRLIAAVFDQYLATQTGFSSSV